MHAIPIQVNEPLVVDASCRECGGNGRREALRYRATGPCLEDCDIRTVLVECEDCRGTGSVHECAGCGVQHFHEDAVVDRCRCEVRP